MVRLTSYFLCSIEASTESTSLFVCIRTGTSVAAGCGETRTCSEISSRQAEQQAINRRSTVCLTSPGETRHLAQLVDEELENQHLVVAPMLYYPQATPLARGSPGL